MGTKYHIDTILNREIHLTGYKLAPSKFNNDPSQALIRQLEGVEITEPLRAKIIKQPIDRGRCFYKIVDPDD